VVSKEELGAYVLLRGGALISMNKLDSFAIKGKWERSKIEQDGEPEILNNHFIGPVLSDP
tara:strand:- start:21 stop:200 length:180 start_codon:yes stop_codon:yes gene_type:complete